jgi:hypothetical protein
VLDEPADVVETGVRDTVRGVRIKECILPVLGKGSVGCAYRYR